jgi:hypothetical protein
MISESLSIALRAPYDEAILSVSEGHCRVYARFAVSTKKVKEKSIAEALI